MCSQGCETITITHTHQAVASIPSPPQLLAIITPFPVSVSSTIRESRSTRYFFFGVRPFHLSCVFKVHPCHSVFQDSWYSLYVPHSSSHMALHWFCVSIVSDAAVRTCTRTCFRRFGICPDTGCWTLLWLWFSFLRSHCAVSTAALPLPIPALSVRSFPAFPISAKSFQFTDFCYLFCWVLKMY